MRGCRSPDKHRSFTVTQASSEQNTIWLTQDAFDKLQAELENLRGPVRSDIVARISAARDEGDLKENGGYHAAREEQGKIEARIRQLEDMLRRAEVGGAPADDGVVEPGMTVTYKFAGDSDDEAETFLLGAREMEDTTDGLRVYSPQSPLGSAIIGHQKGDTVTYEAPNGKKLQVEIVDAVPYSACPSLPRGRPRLRTADRRAGPRRAGGSLAEVVPALPQPG